MWNATHRTRGQTELVASVSTEKCVAAFARVNTSELKSDSSVGNSILPLENSPFISNRCNIFFTSFIKDCQAVVYGWLSTCWDLLQR